MKSTGTLNTLQSLRFIAAAIVILTHAVVSLRSIALHQGRALEGYLFHWIHDFGQAGVDIFFIISGFIMIYIAKPKWKNSGFGGDFMVRRIIRIYPLYWIFLVVAIGSLFLKNHLAGSMYVGDHLAVDPGWLVKSFFLIPVYKPNADMGPVLGPGWTLIFEMFFYVCLVIATLPKKGNPLIALLLMLFSLVGLGWAIDLPYAWFKVCTHPLLLEFGAGCLLAVVYPRLKLSKLNAFYVLILGFILLGYFAGYARPQGKLSAVRFIYYGGPSLLIVLGALALERHCGAKVPGWCIQLGDSSYSAYLSHAAFSMKFVGLVILKLSLLDYISAWGIIFFQVIFCLSVGHVSYLLLERPLAGWLKTVYSVAKMRFCRNRLVQGNECA